ncbi:hypothetical protein ABK040_002156 [Willaertia magna]
MSQPKNNNIEQTETENYTSSIPTYRLLSKSSGLRVFPIALGTGHFGYSQSFANVFGVGGKDEEQEKIFLDYIQRGGNFIDTANFYHTGQSEILIGKLIKKHNINRNDLIIATKYSGPMDTKPNQAGNHKKNLVQSVEGSLQRLQIDYCKTLDILELDALEFSENGWIKNQRKAQIVKIQAMLQRLDHDCPAYIVSRANTYANIHALSPFVAYQGQYSLVDRSVEQEVLPMTKDLDLGFIPWGVVGAEFQIQDKVFEIAKEIGRSPSQVAINWMLQKSGVPSVLIGPRTFEQYLDNIKALEFKLNDEQLKQLDEVSKNSPNIIFPHNLIGNSVKNNQVLYVPEKKYNIE